MIHPASSTKAVTWGNSDDEDDDLNANGDAVAVAQVARGALAAHTSPPPPLRGILKPSSPRRVIVRSSSDTHLAPKPPAKKATKTATKRILGRSTSNPRLSGHVPSPPSLPPRKKMIKRTGSDPSLATELHQPPSVPERVQRSASALSLGKGLCGTIRPAQVHKTDVLQEIDDAIECRNFRSARDLILKLPSSERTIYRQNVAIAAARGGDVQTATQLASNLMLEKPYSGHGEAVFAEIAISHVERNDIGNARKILSQLGDSYEADFARRSMIKALLKRDHDAFALRVAFTIKTTELMKIEALETIAEYFFMGGAETLEKGKEYLASVATLPLTYLTCLRCFIGCWVERSEDIEFVKNLIEEFVDPVRDNKGRYAQPECDKTLCLIYTMTAMECVKQGFVDEALHSLESIPTIAKMLDALDDCITICGLTGADPEGRLQARYNKLTIRGGT